MIQRGFKEMEYVVDTASLKINNGTVIASNSKENINDKPSIKLNGTASFESCPSQTTNGVNSGGVSVSADSDVKCNGGTSKLTLRNCRSINRSISESEASNYKYSYKVGNESNLKKVPEMESDLILESDQLERLVLPVPPDGGWGWVIVVVSFVCCAVVDGMCSVFGVLLPYLVEYFHETTSKTSVAGSVFAGGFLLSGLVSSVCINKFGCRITTIAGGIISAVAFIASASSPNVNVFILVFGALGGLGMGLIYLPASVMVGYYFERRRGLAAGIACSGAGAGMLILSPLAGYLVEEYNWKGCLLIMAGVNLQCIICGSLMRPLMAKISAVKCITTDEDCNTSNYAANLFNTSWLDEEGSSIIYVGTTNVDSKYVERDQDPNVPARNNSPQIEQQQSVASNQVTQSGKKPELMTTSCIELPNNQSNVSAQRFHFKNSAVDHVRKLSVQEQPSNQACPFRSIQELPRHFPDIQSPSVKNRSRRSVAVVSEVEVNPLRKKDIFYSGSVASLHRSMSHCGKNPMVFDNTFADLPVPTQKRTKKSRFMSMFSSVVDISLLCNWSFILITLGSVFIQLGFFIPILFLPDYAQKLGISRKDGSTLLAVLGASNMLGRACAGAMASVECVNILHLNSLCLMAAGVCTMAVVFCQTFEMLIVYCVVFGFIVAAFIPLTTIFLVKYVGLDKLTNSFGLLCMIKGISTMVGPPIAGSLYDATNSYNYTFYFGGSMFVAAGIIFYLLPFSQRQNMSIRHECALYYKPGAFADWDDN